MTWAVSPVPRLHSRGTGLYPSGIKHIPPHLHRRGYLWYGVKQRLLVTALVVGVVGAMLLLAPVGGQAGDATTNDGRDDGWIEQLTGFVVAQQEIAQAKGEGGPFDPYLDRLLVRRILVGMDDQKSTYIAMNHFMDMLEARQGGISARAAEAIWDYSYQLTRPALHDVKRHKRWWDKTVDWDSLFCWNEGTRWGGRVVESRHE